MKSFQSIKNQQKDNQKSQNQLNQKLPLDNNYYKMMLEQGQNLILNQIKEQSQMNKKIEDSKNDKYYFNKPADFSYLQIYGYQIYQELGRGGYGTVYKAINIKKKENEKFQKVAIKINFQTIIPELIYIEVAFLQLIKNTENLPNLNKVFIHNNKIHIVIDYYKHQPFISYFDSFNMIDIKYYLYNLLKAINNLQQFGIIHRDIKPANFLYDPENRKGMLVDFGLSEVNQDFIENLRQKIKQEQNQMKDIVSQLNLLEIYENISKCQKIIGTLKFGTECFMGLECHLKYKNQTGNVDIWGVGVIFFQFLTRKYNVFNNCRQIHQFKIIGGNRQQKLKSNYIFTYIMELAYLFGTDEVTRVMKMYDYDVQFPENLNKKGLNFKDIIKLENFDDQAEDLLKKMLNIDCTQRITAEQALNHEFFKDIK